MSKPWFRLYSEFLSDPKMQLLAFEDQRHFVCLLCLKCNGTLDTFSVGPDHFERMISKALGLDPVTGAEVKRRLIEVGLITESWQPMAWDKRQYESDSSTARVHKWRAEKERNVTETLLQRSRTDTDTDTDTDTEQKKRERSPRGSRLSPEWFPDDKSQKFASALGLEVNETAAKFVDYWTARGDKGAIKTDWDATWRNWCRKDSESSRPKTVSSEARHAWNQLIATNGAERNLETQQALDAIGGWQAIRMRTPYDEQKLIAKFCEAYTHAA